MSAPKPFVSCVSLEYLLGFEKILDNLEQQTVIYEEQLRRENKSGRRNYQNVVRDCIKNVKTNYMTYLETGIKQGSIEEIEIIDENI